MPTQAVWPVLDATQVGAVRRAAQSLAESAGFGETASGRVNIVSTELANNLVRHAGGGRLLMQLVHNGDNNTEVELISVDSGPGMHDVTECLRDGFSSGGTSGTGLGAVRRLSSTFDVHSLPGRGTAIVARVSSNTGALAAATRAASPWRWGAVSTPAPGETVCGDSWLVVQPDDTLRVMVADGLGHGPLAAEASSRAAEIFAQSATLPSRAFFDRAHAQLRSTRGAAVAVAVCPREGPTLSFSGVGNIAGLILKRDGRLKGLMSHNGTVGAEMRTVQEIAYDWAPGDRLIMHSDGLTSRWTMEGHAGLSRCHPSVISAVLHRDFLRGRDDATIVVVERAA